MRQDFPTIDKHQWLQKLIVFIVVGWVIWYTWKEIIKIFFFFFTPWIFYYCYCSISWIYCLWKITNQDGHEDNINDMPYIYCKGLTPSWSRCANYSVSSLDFNWAIDFLYYNHNINMIYIYIYYNRCDLIMMFYNGHMPFFFFLFFQILIWFSCNCLVCGDGCQGQA